MLRIPQSLNAFVILNHTPRLNRNHPIRHARPRTWRTMRLRSHRHLRHHRCPQTSPLEATFDGIVAMRENIDSATFDLWGTVHGQLCDRPLRDLDPSPFPSLPPRHRPH